MPNLNLSKNLKNYPITFCNFSEFLQWKIRVVVEIKIKVMETFSEFWLCVKHYAKPSTWIILYKPHTNPMGAGILIRPILQVRKLRIRKNKCFAENHQSSKYKSSGPKPGRLAQALLLISMLYCLQQSKHYFYFTLDNSGKRNFSSRDKTVAQGSNQPTICFSKSSFIGTQPHPFLYVLCKAASTGERQVE